MTAVVLFFHANIKCLKVSGIFSLYFLLVFPFLFLASSQQNLEELSSSDDERENLSFSQKVCTDYFYVLKGSIMQVNVYVLYLHVFTFSEMFHTFYPSCVQRDRGGSRRRQWHSRLKENN